MHEKTVRASRATTGRNHVRTELLPQASETLYSMLTNTCMKWARKRSEQPERPQRGDFVNTEVLAVRLWNTHRKYVGKCTRTYWKPTRNIHHKPMIWDWTKKRRRRPKDLLVAAKGPKSLSARRCLKHGNNNTRYVTYNINYHTTALCKAINRYMFLLQVIGPRPFSDQDYHHDDVDEVHEIESNNQRYTSSFRHQRFPVTEKGYQRTNQQQEYLSLDIHTKDTVIYTWNWPKFFLATFRWLHFVRQDRANHVTDHHMHKRCIFKLVYDINKLHKRNKIELKDVRSFSNNMADLPLRLTNLASASQQFLNLVINRTSPANHEHWFLHVTRVSIHIFQ